MEQPRFNLLSREKESIINKWKESGLLDGLTLFDKSSVAQIYESQATQLLNSIPISMEDTISYFENRAQGARTPQQKIRPMQQLITVMIVNIRKKHCS